MEALLRQSERRLRAKPAVPNSSDELVRGATKDLKLVCRFVGQSAERPASAGPGWELPPRKATIQRAPGASAECEGCIRVVRRGSQAPLGTVAYSVTFVPYLIGSAWRCRSRCIAGEGTLTDLLRQL